MFIVGLSVLLYPAISDYLNSKHASKVISEYNDKLSVSSEEEIEAVFKKAEDYNKRLHDSPSAFFEPSLVSGYKDTLDITGTGIMGYITIPKINVYLPIYHGTSPEVLNIAVGHLQGSSLPTGGKGRHTVISAHRGLPSAKLFTDIDNLIEDDVFTLTILDEVLTYEVDQINIVLPTDRSELTAADDMDLVTLMTCTPYGVNTHRLLVRAHRIDTVYPHNVRVPADAVQVDDLTVYSAIVAAVLILLLIYWLIMSRLRRSHNFSQEKIYDIPLKKNDNS